MRNLNFLKVMMLLFIINPAFAIHLEGTAANLIDIINETHSTKIYIRNYQNQKFLIYQSDFVFPVNAVIGVYQEKKSDIVWLDFDCDKTNDMISCSRFFNRRTNQLSDMYEDLLGYNPKQNVVANYVYSKNLVMLTPLFEKCKHPLTYKIKIYSDTDFGIKTQFLDNGDLQLDYSNPKDELILKVLPINYQQLYKNCGLKPP